MEITSGVLLYQIPAIPSRNPSKSSDWNKLPSKLLYNWPNGIAFSGGVSTLDHSTHSLLLQRFNLEISTSPTICTVPLETPAHCSALENASLYGIGIAFNQMHALYSLDSAHYYGILDPSTGSFSSVTNLEQPIRITSLPLTGSVFVS